MNPLPRFGKPPNLPDLFRFRSVVTSNITSLCPISSAPCPRKHVVQKQASPSTYLRITSFSIASGDRRETDAGRTAMDTAEVSRLTGSEVQAVGEISQNSRPPVARNSVHDPCPEPSYETITSVVPLGSEDESSNADGSADRKKILPEELLKSVVMLSCESTAEGGSCDIYLVGTAHVSEESCRQVEAVIRLLKPQVVFLELCSSRVPLLTTQNLKVPTMAEMVDSWKKNHNMFGILYSWFLAKVAHKLGVFPGSEFRVAVEEAMKYGGEVILGDRPVDITLKRTWGKMPRWHKAKLLYSLLFQAFFLPSAVGLNKMLKEMDNIDMLTLVIQEMRKEFPTLMETLVHERDQFMSAALLEVARKHSSVVAVVGKGHLQGIKNHWQQPVNLWHLLESPSQKPAVSAVKILTSLGVAVAGVAIISGIYLAKRK